MTGVFKAFLVAGAVAVSPSLVGQIISDATDAEVRKVDKNAGKVTLKHGEIKGLNMPAMTMVFSVKDKSMLNSVKTGDKVRVKVMNDSGKLTVTEIQPAK